MTTMRKEEQAELLFQASGSMKLLKVWMERVGRQTSETWNDNLTVELQQLCSVVSSAVKNVDNLIYLNIQRGSFLTFREKMEELLGKINTRDMNTIQSICRTIQNQIDYIVNDLDKRRKVLYES